MKEKISKKKIYSIVAIIILCSVSFYAGNKHGQSKLVSMNQANGSFQNGMGGGPNRRNFGGGNVNGEVFSKDDTSITVKMRDGSTRIVLYSPSTQVFKSSTSTTADVTTGETVSIMGPPAAVFSEQKRSVQ